MFNIQISSHLLRAAKIAAAAGASQLKAHRGNFSVREKAPKDLVTEADLASQKAIQSILIGEFPDHIFIGEEDGLDLTPEDIILDPDCPPIWIVDPLDGTVNYVHQLQSYAVSIALFYKGQVQLGVVNDPVSNEVYWAERGQGAFMNDIPICVASTDELDQSLLACSFSSQVDKHDDELSRFCSVLPHAQAIRRLGSAALNLCYVACGRLDGYWATSVKPWDVAAGSVILSEAGGRIAGINGGAFDVWDPKFSSACSGKLNDTLLARLQG